MADHAALDAFIARRERLHDQYAAHSGLVDASRLAHLHGPRVRLSDDQIDQAWSRVAPRPDAQRNHVYVHVPFCKSICSFCNYVRLRPASRDQLQRYTDAVCARISSIAPRVAHLEFSSIYFGGGTPSTLTAEQLEQVMGALDGHLRFHPQAGRHFEFDPAMFTADKLKVAVDHGFERFSFGIQTLDTEVNRAHNRGPQSRELLQRRFGELTDAGVADRSCDILLGLAGTTPEQMVGEIGELLASNGPDQVHVFLVTPTDSYVDAHFDGSYDRFWNHLRQFEERALPQLAALARFHGFTHHHGSSHVVQLQRIGRESGVRGVRAYTPLSHLQGLPVNVLAFGPGARGSIFGTLQYENMHDDTSTWVEGYRLQPEDEARVHLCQDLRDRDTLDPVLFRRLHGVDFQERFPIASAALARLGLYQPGSGSFTAAGRRERTRMLMWLVDEARIEDEVARHLGFDRSPGALLRRIAPLVPGTPLPGGAVLDEPHEGHLAVSHEGRTHLARVAPPFEGGGARLVLLQRGPAPVQRAWRVLGRLLERGP